MENEENRGLNNKKASEDWYTNFFQVSFRTLSYSWTLRFFLEHSWRSVAYLEFWSKKEKEEQESARGHQYQ